MPSDIFYSIFLKVPAVLMSKWIKQMKCLELCLGHTDYLINISFYYNKWEGQKQSKRHLAWIHKIVQDNALTHKFKKYETSSNLILSKINENKCSLTCGKCNKICLCELDTQYLLQFHTHTDCFWKSFQQNKYQLQTCHLYRHVFHRSLYG